jgi:hypothetical protein
MITLNLNIAYSGKTEIIIHEDNPYLYSESGVTVQVSIDGRLSKRNAIRSFGELINKSDIDWITPRNRGYELNLDLLKLTLPERYGWLEGVVIISPDIEYEKSDAFGEPSIETVVQLCIYEKEFLLTEVTEKKPSSNLPDKYVFISYVRENADQVDKVASALGLAGVNVWLDRDMITPGQRWKDAIRCAIREGAFFIACFSSQYAERERTYMNEELSIAIEELRLRSSDRAWFLPVTLDGAKIPDKSIGGGETLNDLQRVDLSKNWEEGVSLLVSTVKESYVIGIKNDLKATNEEVAKNSKYQIEVIEVEFVEEEEEYPNPEPLIIGKRLKNYGFKVQQGGWEGSRLLAKYPPERVNSIYVIHRGNNELAERLGRALTQLKIAPRVVTLTTKEVAAASHNLDENSIIERVDAAVAFRAVGPEGAYLDQE